LIKSFASHGTSDIYSGKNTKNARKTCPRELWSKAHRLLHMIDSAKSLKDLKKFPGQRIKKLAGKRKNEYSMRINRQFRICFYWSNKEATEVSIEDYHK